MTHAHHRGEANGLAHEATALTEAEVLAELAKLLGGAESAPARQTAAGLPASLPPPVCSPVAAPNSSESAQAAIAPEPSPASASDATKSDAKESDAKESNAKESDAIAQLQTLLFNVDDAQLKQLMERLENPRRRAIDVAEVLHEAVQHRVEIRHDQFVAAMVPTIEQAIERSIRQDEQVMSEAIFPIVGSAARKAIAAALENAMQALDQTLEQTFSPRMLQWKIEAWRTGRPFAEVVLLRTLLFRVEQVFLIHRHTGLLLQHCVAPTIAAQDPDLVSAMLSAIQSFVQDSFTVQSGEMLETLRFGDLTIWIEPGPQAILAGVIRGQAPLELRVTFRQTIEQIHRKLGTAIAAFQGDAKPFAAAVPDLENCLQTRYKVARSKGSPFAWAVLSVVLLGMGTWGYRDFQIRQRWKAYVRQVEAEPGIVVTESHKGWSGFSIAGLRDPLAIDPVPLLLNHEISPAKVSSQWQPYLSLDPELIEARANQVLQPPDGVTLQMTQSGILRATGIAPLTWLEQSRQRASAIAGVTQFQEAVTIADLQTLRAIQQRLEAQVLRFNLGSVELLAGEPAGLANMTADLKTLAQLADRFDKQVRVAVVGRANRFGGEPQNLRLSQQRADRIRAQLLNSGVRVASLRAIGIGTRQPLSDPTIPAEDLNRSVTLQISFVDVPQPRTSRP